MNRVVRSLGTPRAARWLFNLYPPYLMTGIRVTRIDPDWRAMEVTMRLHWYNRNYFGTHFGGSLYAMSDPFFVLMLANILGPDYFVTDQAAKIEFLRPGKGRVRADFRVDEAMISEVRERTADGEKYLPVWPVEVVDEQGEVIARVTKTLYVRLKRRARDGTADPGTP
jgi:acyl-coenzyme A thioesterase PaaI-like protein